MDQQTLDDLYNQMMGVMPAPEMAPSPYAVPESALVDPMLGVTPAFGASVTAQDQYGYSPQPRAQLPQPIMDPAAELFGPFRGVWDQAQAEPDPLAALMAQPVQEEVMDPRVPELPWEPARAFGQPPVAVPTEGERVMMDRYPRAMERINQLRLMRAQRGF